ncbi:hypothetical protein CY35_16G087900 [Sphagnum magellanicum]|nr:hypothetical protein CY35_16G087900 [Sphagnum magellanicum]
MVRRLSILKQPIFSTLNNHLIDYPTPSNLSYWWSFAFLSIEHIMRDVKGGWLLHYMHANGASMFFIVVYLHIFHGLYYRNYANPRKLVSCLGVVILLLMIVTAFIGYKIKAIYQTRLSALFELTFSSRSGDIYLLRRVSTFHLTNNVITSLASAIPVVGDTIVTWLWGDLVGWVAFAIFFSIFLFYAPNVLGHPDNYIPANPMSAPTHIVLECISNKSGGVAAIGLVFVSLFALPFINTSYVRWIGCQPMEAPYVTIGQIASVGFFFYFSITFIIGKL